jgi:hypothetical protein
MEVKMEAAVKQKEVVCDICRRLFKDSRKRYYCEHCKVYFFVCNHCKEKLPKCRYCGIILAKKSAPIA